MAELRLQLADRERRLAELTEQSLQILDRLAESRATTSERGALFARIAELQELLADTRQRVRFGSRAVLANGLEQQAPFAVVVWDLGGDAGRLAASVAGVTAPVTALMGPRERVDTFADGLEGHVSLHETDCATPAHFWNQAMATTQAPVVVLLQAGSHLDADALGQLAAAASADGVAIAVPVLDCGEGRSLGRAERALLDLVPQPCSETSGLCAVPFASPEAFALSRAAFERVGLFDQDVVGDLALAEWVLRAGARQYRCLGVAEAIAALPQLRAAAEPAVIDADRLVVLARHRPQQLAAAALAADSLWQQEPDAVAAALRAVFRRLPQAAEFGQAIELLVLQAQTVAGWKRLAPALRERIVGVAGELRVPVGEVVTDPGLVTLAERLQATAAVMRERSAELDVRHREAQELRQALAGRDQIEQELRRDIIARSNTVDALRHEINEREHAIASLREEVGHRRGESDRLVDHLGRVEHDFDELKVRAVALTTQNSVLESECMRLTEQIAALQAQQQVDASRITDVEQRLVAETQHSRELEGQLGKALGRQLALDPELHAARSSVQAVEQMLAEESERLHRVLGEIDELRGGHESLRREYSSLQEQRIELEVRAHELVLLLRERERWIADLLGEVQDRRWRRRELTPAEAEFMARHAGLRAP